MQKHDTQELLDEFRELRKDKARLDWLEAKCREVNQSEELDALDDVAHNFIPIREAIDARMKS